MNKLVDAELKKCLYANVPKYSPEDTCITIMKTGIHRKLEAREGCMFLIEISDTVLFPQEGSTLHINWNGGTVPPTKYMNVVVTKVMGKMFQVDGIGFDIDNQVVMDCSWKGWLPTASVVFKKELTGD